MLTQTGDMCKCGVSFGRAGHPKQHLLTHTATLGEKYTNVQNFLFSSFSHYEEALASLRPPGGQGAGGLAVKTLITVGIPHICHFFYTGKFLENKIYTENHVNYDKLQSKLPILRVHYDKLHSKLPFFLC